MKWLLTLCILALFAHQHSQASEAVDQQLQSSVAALREAFGSQPYDQTIINQQITILGKLSSEAAEATDWPNYARVTSVHAEVLQLTEQAPAAISLLEQAREKIDLAEHRHQLTYQLASIYGDSGNEAALNKLIGELKTDEQTHHS